MKGICDCARIFAIANGFAIAALSGPGVAGAPTGEPSAAAQERNELVRQALMYEHGEGVLKDQRKAADIYCFAARQFDAEAQYNLGWMYANGRGLPRDDELAAGLFASAAALDYAHADQALRLLGAVAQRLPACMTTPEPLAQDGLASVDPMDAGPDPFDDLPAWKRKIADAVGRMAPRYSIETRLALAIIAVESNFERDALSNKGAAGLMQLIPETAARFNVRSRYDVNENLRGGLAYLRWLLAYYQGQVSLAAAAYNAGEKVVDRYRGIPPYAETRDYVRKVLRLYGRERHPYEAGIVEPSPVVTRSGPR